VVCGPVNHGYVLKAIPEDAWDKRVVANQASTTAVVSRKGMARGSWFMEPSND